MKEKDVRISLTVWIALRNYRCWFTKISNLFYVNIIFFPESEPNRFWWKSWINISKIEINPREVGRNPHSKIQSSKGKLIPYDTLDINANKIFIGNNCSDENKKKLIKISKDLDIKYNFAWEVCKILGLFK